MLILALRTDQPDAELGLYNDTQQLAGDNWPAHRQLSVTLHVRIAALLQGHGKIVQDIQGIVCFKGPGSFTGLRIGLSVANALAYGLSAPIIATEGSQWLLHGVADLLAGRHDHLALPEYGAPVHITQQKK